MANVRVARPSAKRLGRSSGKVGRVPWAALLPVLLIVVAISGALNPGHASAATCVPSWKLVSESDNSFVWHDLLNLNSVSWTGSVQLYERYDSDCNTVEILLAFDRLKSGSALGGLLVLSGWPLVSFTIQYPSPFDGYANVGQGAIGDLHSWNPPEGGTLTYVIEARRDINARGADEFRVGAQGVPGVAMDMEAYFSLPLDLLGQTVYAQVHVGPDLCRCRVTEVNIPGAPPSPPPPPPPPPPTSTWNVYVHAHEDDWQLFQSPDVYGQYQAGDNLLFIYTTAGDAGTGASYWRAREEAAMASVRWIVGTGAAEGNGTASLCYETTIPVCHDVWQQSYGRTISFFMRLPDGNPDGTGYPATGFQTLSKFRDGAIPTISAVDGSTTYNSWQDLYLTLNTIITTYTSYDSSTRVNSPDFDRDRQFTRGGSGPNACASCPDHADHLATADLVYNITIGMAAPWGRVWFIDYPIGNADPRYPANLDSTGYQIKKDLFMAYSARLQESTGFNEYASLQSWWENCFQRNYYREA